MAGFVILFEHDSLPEEREISFNGLLNLTAKYKYFEKPVTQAIGRNCTSAKFDSSSSLHKGIVRDSQNGSWLFAAGSIVALVGDNDPSSLLSNLLRGYIENGIDVIKHYDGQFALVIYNARDETLSVISDPMGFFAIYYARQGRQVFISTSALAIAKQISSNPDSLSIESFLRTGRTYGEKTLWQDVKRLRPASLLQIIHSDIVVSEYWTLSFDKNISHLPLTDALIQAKDIVLRTFKRCLQREGKIWVDLTGGFDTRVVAMFVEQIGIPFIAYCVGPEDHPDVQVSKLICQKMGWEYQHMPMADNWKDEQFSWFEYALHKGEGQLNVLQLAYTLKGQRERSLLHSAHTTGAGVDEWRYHIYGSKILFHSTRARVDYDEVLDTRILSEIPLWALRQDRTLEVRADLKNHLAKLESNHIGEDILTRLDVIFIRHRHPIHGGAYLSAEAGIMRALMPYCFKELENFGCSLNPKWRMIYHYGMVRNILEMVNPNLAGLRTAKGEPAIPIRLTNIHRFGPLWRYLGALAIEKSSLKLIRKPVRISHHQHSMEYPLPVWGIAWLNWAKTKGFLDPSRMHSGSLYNASNLLDLVEESIAGKVNHREFLDRVITVEMAMQTVGTGVQ
jgi:hypothetical protein